MNKFFNEIKNDEENFSIFNEIIQDGKLIEFNFNSKFKSFVYGFENELEKYNVKLKNETLEITFLNNNEIIEDDVLLNYFEMKLY